MITPTITEPELFSYGFATYVSIKDPLKKWYEHPTFGRLHALPTHRQLLDHVFNLAVKRAPNLL